MRAVHIAEEACFATDTVTDKGVCIFIAHSAAVVCHANAPRICIWSGRYAGPLTAELVWATQPSMTVQEATGLLQRIAQTPGMYDISQQTLGSLKQWATWGGRGWLGVYRSLTPGILRSFGL